MAGAAVCIERFGCPKPFGLRVAVAPARRYSVLQGCYETVAPTENIVVEYPGMKAPHALPSLLFLKSQRALDGRSRPFLLKRIHQQGFTHLCSGACKFAQYEH